MPSLDSAALPHQLVRLGDHRRAAVVGSPRGNQGIDERGTSLCRLEPGAAGVGDGDAPRAPR